MMLLQWFWDIVYLHFFSTSRCSPYRVPEVNRASDMVGPAVGRVDAFSSSACTHQYAAFENPHKVEGGKGEKGKKEEAKGGSQGGRACRTKGGKREKRGKRGDKSMLIAPPQQETKVQELSSGADKSIDEDDWTEDEVDEREDMNEEGMELAEVNLQPGEAWQTKKKKVRKSEKKGKSQPASAAGPTLKVINKTSAA